MPRTASKAKTTASRQPANQAESPACASSLSDNLSENDCLQPYTESFSGLYVFGRVSDRARRIIPTKNDSTAEIVTYTVEDTASHKYYVDEYAPTEYHDVGSFVSLPVYVKTYRKRNGDIGYSFCLQQQHAILSRGERF